MTKSGPNQDLIRTNDKLNYASFSIFFNLQIDCSITLRLLCAVWRKTPCITSKCPPRLFARPSAYVGPQNIVGLLLAYWQFLALYGILSLCSCPLSRRTEANKKCMRNARVTQTQYRGCVMCCGKTIKHSHTTRGKRGGNGSVQSWRGLGVAFVQSWRCEQNTTFERKKRKARRGKGAKEWRQYVVKGRRKSFIGPLGR